MLDGVTYLSGEFPSSDPLQRYLPPLPAGVGKAWLSEHASPGAWIIDPFGASPSLLVEAARSGYRLLAAVNNPIIRFLIELYANPPDLADLQAGLADLAAAQKAGERIEPQIRALYHTECAQCGSTIEAQAFVWERESNAEKSLAPVSRIYTCPVCKDSGERPAGAADADRARKSAASPLHRSRALERVAALSDPDRAYAEEALAVYPARAVHALFDLTNRLNSLAEPRRRWVSALLLAAFDQSSGLWHQPAVRYRPKQLGLPQRYLEKNVWLALESAIQEWSAALGAGIPEPAHLSLTVWPDLPDGPSGICLFEGRLKDLAAQIETRGMKDLEIQAALGALPRPNQAFWTLSALWAGWLWGQAASAPFKSVLRRRRYDWNWHVVALSAALSSLAQLLAPGAPCLGLIGEAEPGFLSASLLAGELSGLDLAGVAIRAGQDQAQIHWKRRADPLSLPVEGRQLQPLAQTWMADYLAQAGEPAAYLKIHTAALMGLVKNHAVGSVVSSAPQEALRQAEEAIQASLSQGEAFVRLGAGGRSLETGQWWLSGKLRQKLDLALPLADRVEMGVVRQLLAHPGGSLDEIERSVCQELRGLFTPDLEMIQECLASYGEAQPETDVSDAWRLRPQDDPAARRADLAEMQRLLIGLGFRLGYGAFYTEVGREQSPQPLVIWQSPDGVESRRFYLTASGVLGKIVLSAEEAWRAGRGQIQPLIVLPGGRAGLVGYKLRRDLRLRAILESEWGFLKFRHVRWLSDNQSLSRENLEEALAVDLLANRDPQMPLL